MIAPNTNPTQPALVFARFAAGMRAVIALSATAALLPIFRAKESLPSLLLLAYLVIAALALIAAVRERQVARHPGWYWIDAAVAVLLCNTSLAQSPGLAMIVMMPVVALALHHGLAHGMGLALCAAAGLMWPLRASLGNLDSWNLDAWVRLSVAGSLVVSGPIAAWLARPAHALTRRRHWLETLQQEAQTRRGLDLNVNSVLNALAQEYPFDRALFSIDGPAPRIYQWSRSEPARTLEEGHADEARRRLAALDRHRTLLVDASGARVKVRHATRLGGSTTAPSDDQAWSWLASTGHAVALSVVSYGQAQARLLLSHARAGFSEDDALWLREALADTMPLLERSDLLEQLQQEGALRERERIGRDLHDSAVQPYVGLKFGLEALLQRARPDNPLTAPLGELARLATGELQTLRDVVGGLRRGQLPDQNLAPLAAIESQAHRFETLYGLRISVFAPRAERLRGTLAKALLHMINECLTNVRRHTSANAVTVMLDVDEEHALLRIRNDHGPGEGLPDDFVPSSVHERATEVGGDVRVEHEQDFTQVTVKVPILSRHT